MLQRTLMAERREPTPLVSRDGVPNFGWARQPVFDLNMAAALSVRRHPFHAWRLKRWEYFYVVTPDIFFAGQVAHLGYLGNVAAYLYDIKRNILLQSTLNIPFGIGMVMASNPRSGTTIFHRSSSPVRYTSTMTADGKRVTVDWPGFGGAHDLHADVLLGWPTGLESLSVVDPLKRGRFAYTTKVMAMPASGTVRVGADIWQCNPADTLGELDWSRGFLEAVTAWKWATASGRTPAGQRVGFNLCSGFHDGGDNENALLSVGGQITKLGLVSFTYDPAHIMQPWHIVSSDGRVDVSFVPLTDHRSDTSAGPLQSHIHQLVGRYSGVVIPEGSDPISLTDFVGAAEDHYARW